MRAPIAWTLCVAVVALFAAIPVRAASPEAKVKAAYLYKMSSFVRWPTSVRSGNAFRICLAAQGDVAGVLRQLVRGQQVGGMPVEVRTLGSGLEGAASCQVLYLGNRPETARQLESATEGQAVLTVGDRDDGTRGGVVDFVVRDGRVRFVIHTGRASSRGLELSSKLMDAAAEVIR